MNVHVQRDIDEPRRREFTVAEVSRMFEASILAEDENVELIDGELIRMASKKFAHERLKAAIPRYLNRVLPDDLIVFIDATLQLADNVLVEPDVLVVPRGRITTSREGFLTLAGADILLLIEIAVSSLRHDLGRKAALYGRHDVRDYWVVDVNNARTHVHRGPSIGGWADRKKVPAGEALRPLASELASVALVLDDLP